MIIEGKRNLSEEMIGRFAKAMGLNKTDIDEFRALVRYGRQKSLWKEIDTKRPCRHPGEK